MKTQANEQMEKTSIDGWLTLRDGQEKECVVVKQSKLDIYYSQPTFVT